MSATPVPVTLGSPRFRHASVRGCNVVHAWFPPRCAIQPHVHEHATLAVMLGGSFDLDFGPRRFDCTPASIAVEPAGERHANYVGSAGADVLAVQPRPEERELWEPFTPLFDSIGFQRHGGIRARASRISAELDKPDLLSALVIEGLLIDILVSALRERIGRGAGTMPSWLERVHAMLHEEPVEELGIHRLAGQAGVHPAHLARAFRRHFRCSIGEYARRIRLERAAGRLVSTGEAIASIALWSGFSDQSHFTRWFRKYYGVTPGAWRQARQ